MKIPSIVTYTLCLLVSICINSFGLAHSSKRNKAVGSIAQALLFACVLHGAHKAAKHRLATSYPGTLGKHFNTRHGSEVVYHAFLAFAHGVSAARTNKIVCGTYHAALEGVFAYSAEQAAQMVNKGLKEKGYGPFVRLMARGITRFAIQNVSRFAAQKISKNTFSANPIAPFSFTLDLTNGSLSLKNFFK